MTRGRPTRRKLIRPSVGFVAAAGCLLLFGGVVGPVERTAVAERTVANLRAFAKLYGYVRWFHPDDRASAIDWDRFAILGARTVRDSRTPDELRDNLEELFRPIAPTMRLYFDGEDPALPSLVPADTNDLRVVAWQHRGVGLADRSRYRSIRLNRPDPHHPAEVQLVREVRATEQLRGRRIRLTADARLEPPRHAAVTGQPDAAGLHLALVVMREDGTAGFSEAMDDDPITSREWAGYEIVGPVTHDATRILLAVVLVGPGRGLVDDLRLDVEREDGTWRGLSPSGLAFGNRRRDEGDESFRGWLVRRSRGAQHRVEIVDSVDDRDDVLLVSLDREPAAAALFPERPSVGEATDAALARGLRAWVPLALYGNADTTLGSTRGASLARLRERLADVDPGALAADDPSVRVAAIVIAWNVLQHFYPYFDVVDVDWERQLDETLSRVTRDAASGRGVRGSLRTLNRMLARLDDAHADAYHPILRSDRGLPIRVDWVQDELVVVATDDTATARPGDVVVSIDGVTAAAWMDREMEYVSGSPRWKRHRALTHPNRGFGRGPVNSETKLALRRNGREMSIRRIRDVPAIPQPRRPESFSRLADSILYVNLVATPMAEIESHIDELAAAEGIVFDLRGHPEDTDIRRVLGYLSGDTLRSGYWLIPQIIYPDHKRIAGWHAGARWKLEPRTPRFRGEAVFLSDASAVSFPEGVLDIVAACNLAEIVGRASAGVTGNVNLLDLPGDYLVGFTGMKYLKPDSTRHHVLGVRPTVPVERSLNAVREGRDELLEAAVRLLQEDAHGGQASSPRHSASSCP